MKWLLLFALSLSAFGSATNVYMTPSGAAVGGCLAGTGSAPNLVLSSSSSGGSNAAASWGAGTGQIGPGTTVLVCGTSTTTAGGSAIIVQNSGTSGNPIVINFDTGAVLQSNAFAGFVSGSPSLGAIVINGYNYVTVNGKSTGNIQNLLNGSPSQTTCLSGTCTVQQSSVGVYVHNTTGVEIKNLNVNHIYMDLAGEQTGGQGGAAWQSADIYTDGPNTGLNIDGNTLNDSHVGAWVSFDNGSTSANIFGNTIAHHGWQISAANGSSCSATGTIAIYGNDWSNWSDWNGAGASSYHTDGYIGYTRSTGCTAPLYNPLLYNNTSHGDLDGGTGSGTAHFFCTNDTDGSTSFANVSCTVFNNVVDMSSSTHCAAAFWDGAQNALFANNTLIAPASCSTGQSIGIELGANAALTVKNNIFENFYYNLQAQYGSGTAGAVTASDHNDWYNCTGVSLNSCFNGTDGNWSFSTWQSSHSFDLNSITTSPNLNSSYFPPSSSPVVGLGANLTGLGITALDADQNGVARPASGAWTAGALSPTSNPMPTAAPASSFSAIVQ